MKARLSAARSRVASVLVIAALCFSATACADSIRSPGCSGDSGAPVSTAAATLSLENADFAIRSLDRAAECGAAGVVATLEDDSDDYALRCVVREAPIYDRGRVIRLPDSPAGATHLAIDNVECFVRAESAQDEVAARARSAMNEMGD